MQGAVIRGHDRPSGHVVAEAWPTPTKSWVKNSTQKEATTRSRANTQVPACGREPAPEPCAVSTQAKKQIYPNHS
jgi:hypothetical protein